MGEESQGAALMLVGCGCVAVVGLVALLFLGAALSGPVAYLMIGA